ncbi:hypothetical protein GCM10009677_25880 [Sphaerisporangium rubeum]
MWVSEFTHHTWDVRAAAGPAPTLAPKRWTSCWTPSPCWPGSPAISVGCAELPKIDDVAGVPQKRSEI